MNRRIIWKSPLGIAIIFHLVVLVLLGYIVHEEAKKEIEFIEVTMEDLLQPQTQTPGPAQPAGGGGSPRRAQVTPQQAAAAPKTDQTMQASPAPLGEDASLPASAGVATGGYGSGDGGGQGGTGDGTGTGNGSGSGSGSGSGNGAGTGYGTSQRPQLVARSKPSYPAEARRNGWEGTVSLRLRISEDGDVAEASVSGSSGYACLDQAALQEVWRWRFNPARDGYGRPVASGVVVPMRFNLEDA